MPTRISEAGIKAVSINFSVFSTRVTLDFCLLTSLAKCNVKCNLLRYQSPFGNIQCPEKIPKNRNRKPPQTIYSQFINLSSKQFTDL